MARCGCGGPCACSLTGDGTTAVVTGSGTAANPWVITSHVNCDEARDCFQAGNGLAYDNATGTFSALASPAAGNTLTSGPAGLFVPAASVTTGCGLSGAGTPASPLTVQTPAWPFTCTPEANGSVVTCDANGLLRGEPPYHTYYSQVRTQRFYSPELAVPAAADTPVDTPFTLTVTNTDPCRTMRLLSVHEFKAYLTIPPGGSAESGFSTEEAHRVFNTGTTTMINVHSYASKLVQWAPSLAPGASSVINIQSELGRGTGGATCSRIDMSIRAFLLPV